MSDFEKIAEMLKTFEITPQDLEHFDKHGHIAFFLKRSPEKMLCDVDVIDDFIGYGSGDYCELGQVFENPYDKYSYFKVVESIPSDDRALLELVKVQ